MWEQHNFILDTIPAGDIFMSILVIQGYINQQEINLPGLLSKNIFEDLSGEFIRESQ